jgi:hypothetical protein
MGPTIVSVWLPTRWVWFGSGPEHWLGLPAYAPLLIVVAHLSSVILNFARR